MLEIGSPSLLFRSDVEHALKNWQDYSSEFGGIMGSPDPLIPLNVDPPLHAKYRRILDPYFGPRKMKALQPAVDKHANDLIDGFTRRAAVATSPKRSPCRCRARRF